MGSGPVSDTTTLTDLAQALLDAAAAAVATTSAGAAALTFLSPGLPALDRGCDIVTVWVSQLSQENTAPRSVAGGQRLRLGWVNVASFSILTGRCLNYGARAIPSPDALNAAAVKITEDGWALWNAIPQAVRDDGLFGGVCKDIRILPMQPLTPQGNVGGWTLTVQAEIPGYLPLEA